MGIRSFHCERYLCRLRMAEDVRKGLLNNPEHRALPLVGQPVDSGGDLDIDLQRRARRKSAHELLNRTLQSVGEQILGMQQVGKGTDLPERLIDRPLDIIADPLCIPDIADRAPHPQQVQAGGNQMLARRIVKVGCNPLLHFFLKRQKPDAEIRRGPSRSSPLNGMAPFFQGPVRFARTRPFPLSNTSSARFFHAALA